jgi:hypothetical protein
MFCFVPCCALFVPCFAEFELNFDFESSAVSDPPALFPVNAMTRVIAPFLSFAHVVFALHPGTERDGLLFLLRAEFRAELDARVLEQQAVIDRQQAVIDRQQAAIDQQQAQLDVFVAAET